MRPPIPLALEIAAARAAGGLCLLAGAGGGTTLPGKLLWKLDPSAVDRLAARLPLGSALVSATNGKTTTAALAARILAARRLAHNASGANLVSGVASTLLTARDAEPRQAHPLQHAADSKYCLRCGTPYEYAAAYVGHLGDYRCPRCGHARPGLDVAARAIELDGLESASFDLCAPAGTARVRVGLPGLYNVYNALAAASLALALGASLDEVRLGLERAGAAFGRFERILVGDRRLLVLLIKNPAGANEAIRTLVAGGAPRLAVVALNDATADGKDVSWIWDVDFEPLLAGLGHVGVAG